MHGKAEVDEMPPKEKLVNSVTLCPVLPSKWSTDSIAEDDEGDTR